MQFFSHCFLIISHDINESSHRGMYCNVLQRWLDFLYVEILSLKIMIPAPHNSIQRCYILKMYRKKYEENTKSSISKLRCWEYIFSVRSLKLKTKWFSLRPIRNTQGWGHIEGRHTFICVLRSLPSKCIVANNIGLWKIST